MLLKKVLLITISFNNQKQLANPEKKTLALSDLGLLDILGPNTSVFTLTLT